MTHERFEALAAVYALGALDGEDRDTFESHLAAGCPRCEALVREAEQMLAQLASAEPRVTPPPAVRDALLGRLATTAPRPRLSRRQWLGGAVAAAAAAVAAAAM